MKRLIAIALLVGACGGGPSAAPSGGASAADPTSNSTASRGPAASADKSVLTVKGAGVTLTSATSGTAKLAGGTYRVAWYAPGCTTLTIDWVGAVGGATPIPVTLPSGETTIPLPAGTGSLNRHGDCDYIIRFEALPKPS